MNRGYIFIFLATVFFSSMEVALKTVAHDFNPMQLNCTRFLVGGLLLIPLAYIASESGWVVAELGRQPWTIQDMLPTWAAISNVQSGSVALTFFVFLALFTTMLVVEINILCKQIKKGPEHTQVLSPSATN